ncbi:xylose isomerase-like protein [Microdochium trichocladiopsis]|uniref:Apurinic-apyrimidinic endonuclease 1 n=1 Tax=Microdochium trichocladiopsis TaxID=1682393 RepID=A0A9P8YBM6_9PEZI|nr:xylose isomerase-like protein [Microdochium trichocladiopsis]KAH7034975.1 xylose isomerase-like protein [Microdochium trichocladiopsis]
MPPRQSARQKAPLAVAKVEKQEVLAERKKPAARVARKPAVVETEEVDVKLTTTTSSTTTTTTTTKASVKRKATEAPAAPKAKAEPVDSKPAPKKRKTKGKEEDTMPLTERTAITALKKAMYIGAHVSSAGGVQNSVGNAVHIGANAFALFLKSQRKWANPPITPESLSGFKTLSKEHGFDAHKHCLPHGSYLVNLAAAEKEKADQAYTGFLDDLQRCESLGITLYNFHPGNTNGEPRPEAIGRIAAQLNKAHAATSTVVTVLENMAGQGNVIGSSWEDLRDIIALVDDKARVGVCIDTCHAFAAGHDLRSPDAFEETMSAFSRVVGDEYLRAFHLNDSKAPLSSNRDLHANIGTGFLGLRAFHNVMNCDKFQGLPMVLETPIDRKGPDGKTVEDKQVWADEIKLLESLIGMDPESDDFKTLEAELHAKGAGERGRIQEQVDRKSAKGEKKTSGAATGKKAAAAAAGSGKGKQTTLNVKRGRKKKEDTSDEESE